MKIYDSLNEARKSAEENPCPVCGEILEAHLLPGLQYYIRDYKSCCSKECAQTWAIIQALMHPEQGPLVVIRDLP